ASLGGPDERREQKFATLVGDHFGMSPTNILLTPPHRPLPSVLTYCFPICFAFSRLCSANVFVKMTSPPGVAKKYK
ncbi:hypothetical protein B1693_14460, partial [Geobacillus zalihae]